MTMRCFRSHNSAALPLALALTLLAAGCAQIPEIGESPAATAERAAKRAAEGDYAEAARLYAAAAKRARGDDRDRLRLAAAEAAIRAGDIANAREWLDDVDDDDLDEAHRARFRLARTEVRIAGLPPEAALRELSPPDSGAPPEVAARIWDLRARLLEEQGRILESVHALTQRDIWLPEPEQARANDERIWRMLTDQVPDGFAPGALDEVGATTRGWAALARIDARSWSGRDALENALIDWERRYPGHPAARAILPEKFDYTPVTPGTAARAGRDIGLALPLTGRFAEPAAAVRNGFLAAYYASEAPRPRLRLYDTNAVPDMAALLERARGDGVGLLVGPLSKSHVAELRDVADPGMAVLALNYAGEAAPASRSFPGFYQFGLAPEDEALAAAERAVTIGWPRALALVPDNEWGDRILSAFRDGLYLNGGRLVDYVRYNPYRQDFSEPIKTLLHYREIEKKEKETEENAEETENEDGENPAEDISGDSEETIEDIPLERGRRHDADFVFVAAQPPQARLIRSQLRFYHAMHLPVMATSHAYGGAPDPARDSDLNGLLFPDMPWILAQQGEIAERRARLGRLWPETSDRYPRLLALGQDAWRLQTRLHGDEIRTGRLFAGDTGELYLYADGEIHRALDWARFVRGRPRPLPPLTLPLPEPPAATDILAPPHP